MLASIFAVKDPFYKEVIWTKFGAKAAGGGRESNKITHGLSSLMAFWKTRIRVLRSLRGESGFED